VLKSAWGKGERTLPAQKKAACTLCIPEEKGNTGIKRRRESLILQRVTRGRKKKKKLRRGLRLLV